MPHCAAQPFVQISRIITLCEDINIHQRTAVNKINQPADVKNARISIARNEEKLVVKIIDFHVVCITKIKRNRSDVVQRRNINILLILTHVVRLIAIVHGGKTCLPRYQIGSKSTIQNGIKDFLIVHVFLSDIRKSQAPVIHSFQLAAKKCRSIIEPFSSLIQRISAGSEARCQAFSCIANVFKNDKITLCYSTVLGSDKLRTIILIKLLNERAGFLFFVFNQLADLRRKVRLCRNHFELHAHRPRLQHAHEIVINLILRFCIFEQERTRNHFKNLDVSSVFRHDNPIGK